MKNNSLAAFKAAFPKTIPIIPGYIFLGIAFGILLTNLGYAWYWSVLMALVIFSGMTQFVLVNMLAPGIGILSTFLFMLSLNARHLFYGLSMLEKFKIMGKTKPYMIFALTDETYSLLCSAKVPEGVDEKKFYFLIAFLDHSYWIIGCLLGGLIGSLITFDTTGIDFSMTALFITIVIDQWRDTKEHRPVLIGFFCSLIFLIILGAEHFIIPALLGITAGLLLFRRRIEEKKEDTADAQ